MRQIIVSLIVVYLPLLINAQQRQALYDFKLPADSLQTLNVGDNIRSFSFDVRGALSQNCEQQGLSDEYWTMVWNYSSPTNYYYVTFRCINSNFGDFSDHRYAQLSVGHVFNGNDSLIVKKDIKKDINTAEGYNSILIECNNDYTRIFIGKSKYQLVAYLDDIKVVSRNKCGVISNIALNVKSMVLESQYDIKTQLKTSLTGDSLITHIQCANDKNVGVWAYLDRDNDSDKARIGGRYKLAVVKNNEGYDLIYLSDAVTNQSEWECGMIKGRLIPTIFENHYDLVWYDSMFEIIETDAYADIIDNSILSLQFPLYNTVIRFSKHPNSSEVLKILFE